MSTSQERPSFLEPGEPLYKAPKKEGKYKVYCYSQNNSGGRFHLSDKGNEPVAHYVYIEASSPEKANELALERTGIYFDDEWDCDCCGSRWTEADEYNSESKSFQEFLEKSPNGFKGDLFDHTRLFIDRKGGRYYRKSAAALEAEDLTDFE